MILLDLLGVPGFSGSPVILENTGEVIGIIYGPGPTERIFGFEWATPITQEDYLSAIDASSAGVEDNVKRKWDNRGLKNSQNIKSDYFIVKAIVKIDEMWIYVLDIR